MGTVLWFLVCVGIPLGGAIYFIYRRDGTVLSFLVGVFGFLISQPLLRLNLLNLLNTKSEWYMLLPYTNVVLYFIFMAFTAAIFEESARWIGMGIFRKGKTDWMDGMAYGLGHGGIEAAWMFFSQVLPAIRSGQEISGWNAVLGSWERFFTMMVQIGFTFVVLYGLKTKKIRYLGLAILLHGVVDFLIIIGNVWILEGLIALEGIAAMLLVFRVRKSWNQNGITQGSVSADNCNQ